MLLLVLVAVSLFLAALLLYAVAERALSRAPPGPVGIPGLGIMHVTLWRQATNKCHRLYSQLQELRRSYGDVVSYRMGTQRFVLISGYEALREAFVTHGDKFLGRGNTNYHKFLFKESGIIGSEGPLWLEHRRFALRVLKDFGFGRNASELQIQEEAGLVVAYLRQKDGQTVNPNEFINPSVANVITRFIFSNFSSYEDPEFKEFTEKLFVLNNQNIISLLTALYRWLPINVALAISPGNKVRFEAITWVEEVSRRQVESIRRKFDPETDEPSNYVEMYLKEQHKRGSDLGTFNDLQLMKTIWELFIAGVETTSSTLRWTLVHAALHPEMQDRCHAEIAAKIGRRQVTLKDKKELHYCQAFLDETQRISTLAPTSVEHRAQQDTEFRGYSISSDDLILANLRGLHHDEKLFPEPSRFDPGRFLTPEGQYKQSEFLNQFGIGKRACLGEVLARMEVFLFFVTYMQNFRFLPADSWTPEHREQILLGTEGLVSAPVDHLMTVTNRDNSSHHGAAGQR